MCQLDRQPDCCAIFFSVGHAEVAMLKKAGMPSSEACKGPAQQNG
jgi:hypothetical protein